MAMIAFLMKMKKFKSNLSIRRVNKNQCVTRRWILLLVSWWIGQRSQFGVARWVGIQMMMTASISRSRSTFRIIWSTTSSFRFVCLTLWGARRLMSLRSRSICLWTRTISRLPCSTSRGPRLYVATSTLLRWCWCLRWVCTRSSRG